MTIDEEQVTKKLLAELGLAFMNAQALEYGMTTLFAATHLAQNGQTSRSTLRQLMDARYAQTLGRLVNDAAEKLALNAELTELLRQALQHRNWLVHHFYREHGHCAFDVALKLKVTDKLRTVRKVLENVAMAVHEEAIARFTQTGDSREEIERRAEAITQKFIQRDLDAPSM